MFAKSSVYGSTHLLKLIEGSALPLMLRNMRPQYVLNSFPTFLSQHLYVSLTKVHKYILRSIYIPLASFLRALLSLYSLSIARVVRF